jgi:hypothetical protein
MLNTDEGQRSKNQEGQKFRPRNCSLHDQRYPFIDEFSEFLSTVSTQALKFQLMTYQQRLLAKSMWEAYNYGGSKAKCEARLKELYGPKWHQITSIADHMEPERLYLEYVLILDYQRQWNEKQKVATLRQSSPSNDTNGD